MLRRKSKNGNGAANEAAAPRPKAGGGMFDMFGLGAALRLAQDPAFQAQVMGMVGAMAESGPRQARIEAKLDFLLQERGVDVGEFNRQWALSFGARLAALPAGRELGGGGPPEPGAASATIDDGACEPADRAGDGGAGSDPAIRHDTTGLMAADPGAGNSGTQH